MAKLISKGNVSLVDDEEINLESITDKPKKKKNGAKLISRTRKKSLKPELKIAKERGLVESTGRKLSSLARGATPALVGSALGSPLGAVGMIAGGLALPAAEGVAVLLNKLGIDAGSPTEKVQAGLTKLGFPVPETTGERAFETAGSFLGVGAPQIKAAQTLSKTATTPFRRGVATELSKQPVRQTVSTIPAGMASQYAYELTDSPTAAMLAGVGGGSTAFLRSPKTPQVPKESLENIAKMSYTEAGRKGFRIDPDKFQDKMRQITSRQALKGFAEDVPTQFPKLYAAVKMIRDKKNPIDLEEINALRSTIKTAKGSTDKDEARLASQLMDSFDDYMLNITSRDMAKTLLITPKGARIKVGKPAKSVRESIELKKQGDVAYTKLKKGEIFEDILIKAKREPATESQTIIRELKKITDNPNKIKFFTKTEQKAINEAVKTKNMRRIYSIMERLAAPRSNLLYGTLAIGSGIYRPDIIIPAILGGMASKARLSSLREKDLESIINTIRSGGQPNLATSPANISRLRTIANQGLLTEENE